MSQQDSPDPMTIDDPLQEEGPDPDAPVDPKIRKVVAEHFDEHYTVKSDGVYDKNGKLQVGEDGKPLTKEQVIEKKARELHSKTPDHQGEPAIEIQKALNNSLSYMTGGGL